jgi:hypothetical protein
VLVGKTIFVLEPTKNVNMLGINNDAFFSALCEGPLQVLAGSGVRQ